MCCSSWLQYRICHSLSTIQYVLVPQVQRQLQAALQRATGSKPASSSRSLSGPRSEPRTPIQLGWWGRNRQKEGSPQDQLRNSQCQDSGEAPTCKGETGLYSFCTDLHFSSFNLVKIVSTGAFLASTCSQFFWPITFKQSLFACWLTVCMASQTGPNTVP